MAQEKTPIRKVFPVMMVPNIQLIQQKQMHTMCLPQGNNLFSQSEFKMEVFG